jgi:hypothetical protein
VFVEALASVRLARRAALHNSITVSRTPMSLTIQNHPPEAKSSLGTSAVASAYPCKLYNLERSPYTDFPLTSCICRLGSRARKMQYHLRMQAANANRAVRSAHTYECEVCGCQIEYREAHAHECQLNSREYALLFWDEV